VTAHFADFYILRYVCRYSCILITLFGKKQLFLFPVKIYSDSYNMDIAESEYDN
jgi:hypothetical protein